MRKEEKKEKRKLEEDQTQFSQFQFTAPVQQPAQDSTSSHLLNGGSSHLLNGGSTSSASSSPTMPMSVNNASEKRKAEDYPEGEESRISEVCEIIEEEVVKKWVCEIEERVEHEEVDNNVHGEEEDDNIQHENENELNQQEVCSARKEEIGYMQSSTILSIKPISDCWEKTGKAPVTARWVDVQKAEGVRSRLVARDFKGGDKDRDDLFAATPSLESKRLLISRAATSSKG